MNQNEARNFFAVLEARLSDRRFPIHPGKERKWDKIFDVVNAWFWAEFRSVYAWKYCLSDPPYNPHLGIKRFPLVEGFELEVCIGLELDGFLKPYYIVSLLEVA